MEAEITLHRGSLSEEFEKGGLGIKLISVSMLPMQIPWSFETVCTLYCVVVARIVIIAKLLFDDNVDVCFVRVSRYN